MLPFAELGEYARLLAGPLETPDGALKRLPISNTNASHEIHPFWCFLKLL
jgi:hypothetical protein